VPAPAAPAASPAAAAATQPASQPSSQPSAGSFDAKAVEEFYKGKTIRVIVATTAGSTYDAWARVITKSMGKYVPGNPGFVVENMPGAGHVIGANYLFNAAPKDGTVIGTFVETQVLNQLAGGKGIEFDMGKFSWIGAVNPSNTVCVARTDIGNKLTDFQNLLGPNAKEAIFGSTGPGATSHDYPVLIREVLGGKIKLVSGYPGNPEVRQAIEKGEAEAYCGTWETVDRSLEPWRQAGSPPFKVLMQEGEERVEELKDVPYLRSFAKTDEERLMIKLLSTPANYTRPYTAPPGTPADRVEALRKAFLEVFKDPELVADAKKARLEFAPRGGQQVQAAMLDILATPPAAGDRNHKMMTPGQ
jgi:tripartite-type tricarboxylate transporter receptor subunit TctC